MRRALCVLPLIGLAACASARVGPAPFVGTIAGISTLSADARTIATAAAFDASLYKPENGPAINVLAGVHVHDYFSVQANYIWNRNTLTASSIRTADGVAVFFEERRRSRQQAFIGDALLYFRDRDSWARPYLSAGVGLVHFTTAAPTLLSARGQVQRPPASFESTGPALRVAVGIDLGSAAGWSFRYSFSETIGGNPVSERLAPRAEGNLANFQNLFGAVRSF